MAQAAKKKSKYLRIVLAMLTEFDTLQSLALPE
jgi:hypothetical protein